MTDPLDPPAPEPPAPGDPADAGPIAPSAEPPTEVAGWASAAPERPESRVRLAISWVIAAVVLGFSAWIAYRTSTGSSAFQLGRGIGAVLAPILVVTLLRWVFVRRTKGRAGRDVLRSSWIPLGAVLIALLSGVQGLSSAVVAADPSRSLRIAAPYALVAADPAIADEITATMSSRTSIRAAVREIQRDGETEGWIIAGNGQFTIGDWEEVVRGMEQEAGQTSTRQMIRGHEVAVLDEDGAALVAWLEPPMMLLVIALDPDAARSIAEAVLGPP